MVMTKPHITITEDRLRALISVGPDIELDLGQLRALVGEAGICYGLLPERLVAAAKPSDETRDIVLAIGTAPVTRKIVHLSDGLSGSKDMVADRQVLGQVVVDETRQPQAGMGVDGKPIDAADDLIGDLLVGKGVELRQDRLVATRGGLFSVEDGLLWRVVDDPRGKPKRDVVLFRSEDDSEAWVRLEGGEFVPSELLQKLLVDNEISYGLDPLAIAEACNGVSQPSTIVVARGRPMVPMGKSNIWSTPV